MKYIDDRGTIFELYKDIKGYVITGNWDFEVVENNIETTGELKIKHCESQYSDKKVINTFKGVKELNNDLLRSSGK